MEKGEKKLRKPFINGQHVAATLYATTGNKRQRARELRVTQRVISEDSLFTPQIKGLEHGMKAE